MCVFWNEAGLRWLILCRFFFLKKNVCLLAVCVNLGVILEERGEPFDWARFKISWKLAEPPIGRVDHSQIPYLALLFSSAGVNALNVRA